MKRIGEMKTGERVELTARVSSSCCGSKILVHTGEEFPLCCQCKEITTWTPLMVRKTEAEDNRPTITNPVV